MAERHLERIHTEQVVLDIGQDVGALVIYTTQAFRGKEIEVSPTSDDAARVHTDVAERQVNDRTVFAGVFPVLPAGDYKVWGPDPDHPGEITIVGGQVAEVDWR